MAVRASRTSSSLNGLMIAITIFMSPIPAWARREQTPGDLRLRFTTRRASTTRAQPALIESNAVPDRRRFLTGYESGPFPALREAVGGVPFRRAYNIITSG